MVQPSGAEPPAPAGPRRVGCGDPVVAVHPRHPRLDPRDVSGAVRRGRGHGRRPRARRRARRRARADSRSAGAALRRDRGGRWSSVRPMRSWNAQGNPEVDAVERVHFVEYGVITLLFYRVWRPRGDVSMFVMPLLAGIAVGTLEEWLQWFIPGRVGDMRDVFLNIVAIVCGLLFSIGVDPPDAGVFQVRPGSLRRMGMVAAAVALLFATFVYSVHLGVEIRDPDTGQVPLTLRRGDARPHRSGSGRGVEGPPSDRAAAQPQPRRSVHERGPAARPRAQSALGGGGHDRAPGPRTSSSRSTMRQSSTRPRTSRAPATAGRRSSVRTPSSAWGRHVLRRARSRVAPTSPRDVTSSARGRQPCSG